MKSKFANIVFEFSTQEETSDFVKILNRVNVQYTTFCDKYGNETGVAVYHAFTLSKLARLYNAVNLLHELRGTEAYKSQVNFICRDIF